MASNAQSLQAPPDELLLGSHVPLRQPDYLLGSVRWAQRLKATSFMVFLGPPRNTLPPRVAEFNAPAALAEWQNGGHRNENIAVHFRYVLNPSSLEEDKGNFAAAFFEREVTAMEHLGLSLCCLHPGSAGTGDRNEGRQLLLKRLKPLFVRHPKVRFAIETMAGKGGETVVGLMEMALVLKECVDLTNVGACLDTCHLWDGGEDLTNTAAFIQHIETTIGLNKVFLVHLNDSKNPRGGGKDRHANLNEGYIGFKALCALTGRHELAAVPKILETPDAGDGSTHAKEIALIRAGLGY